jgi:hypothetical protein
MGRLGGPAAGSLLAPLSPDAAVAAASGDCPRLLLVASTVAECVRR